MQNIQSMLAIGAMIILSLTSLSFNSVVLQNSATELEDKVVLTAFSLADDLIEEIKEKSFDQNTIDFQAIALNQLTAANGLGPGGTESWPNFNDIDDYNGYTKEISLPHVEGYNLTCKVHYVDADGDILSTQSYFKRVDITVTSDYMSQPLVMSFIFSLHAKN